MSTFERYLTLWVALCIVVGIALGHVLPAVFRAIGSAEVAQVNLPVAVLIWLMIIPMLVKIDFAALGRGPGALARHRRDPVRQLGRQAVLDGAARLALHRLAVPALPAGRPDQQLHRRADPARRRALHGDGLRLEQPVRRRAALHAEPGRAQRHHHGVRLRADRRPAARPLGDHGAVGDAAALGRRSTSSSRSSWRRSPAPDGSRAAGRPRSSGCSTGSSRSRSSRC